MKSSHSHIRQRLFSSGFLRRMVIIRHGNTDRPPNDLDRQLTSLGFNQCESARRWAPPFAPLVLCSRARRTQQTAQCLYPKSEINELDCMYPEDGADRCPNRIPWDIVNEVFSTIGHAPLRTYLDHDGGRLSPFLDQYAANVWNEALAVAQARADGTGTLAIISHSIFLSAIAQFVASTFGLDSSCVRESKVGEACGFIIELEQRGSVSPGVRYMDTKVLDD